MQEIRYRFFKSACPMIRNSTYTHKNFQRMNKQIKKKNRTKSSPILMKFEVEVDHIVSRLW